MAESKSYIEWLRACIGHAPLPLAYSTAIVRDAAGRILLHQRSDFHRWGLPGGVIEPGESPADCAMRETLEETGVRVRTVRLVAVLSSPEHMVEYPNGDRAQPVSPYLECEAIGGRLLERAAESTAVAFFPPDQLPELFPWYARALQYLSATEPFFEAPIHATPGQYPEPIWKSIRAKTGPAPLVLPGASALIHDERGRILMVRRTDNGRWWLPGGLMELGENLAATAIREVREEAGLDVEPVRLAGIFSGHRAQISGPDQLFPLSTWFECRTRGGICKPDHIEVEDTKFFSPDRLPEMPDGLADRLRQVLASPHRAIIQ
jgi:8-oxo-dGTP diphosphatase